MIVRKHWLTTDRYETQVVESEGWYLLGFIPLYVYRTWRKPFKSSRAL